MSSTAPLPAERRDREIVGSGVAGRDRGRRAGSGRRARRARTRRGSPSPAVASSFAVAQHDRPVGCRTPTRTRSTSRHQSRGGVVGVEDALDRLERVEARVGEALDAFPLLDRRAVDLFDLAHEQLHEIRARDARPRTRRPRRVRCVRARRRRRCRRRSRRCATRRDRAHPDGREATRARRGERRRRSSGESRVVVMAGGYDESVARAMSASGVVRPATRPFTQRSS